MRTKKPTGIGLGFYAHSFILEKIGDRVVKSAIKAGPFWGTVRTGLKFTVGATLNAHDLPTPLARAIQGVIRDPIGVYVVEAVGREGSRIVVDLG